MKKYFLGPNAANFLANQMRNQGASTEEPVLHRGRVSGSIIPFKITGDWEQRNGESVYSCIAHEVFFDGTNYVTDQESLDFFLYSPIHLSEKPDNAVGDIIFAVLRGNNWEIIGGGGGGSGSPLIVDTLTSTLIKSGTATTYKGHIVTAPVMMSGRAVSNGTPITHIVGDNGQRCLVDWEYYSTQMALRTPTLQGSGNGVYVASPLIGVDATLNVTYNLYTPFNSLAWTTAGNPPQTITPTYPCWLFVRFETAESGFLPSPWSGMSVRGNISDADLITATPDSSQATTTVEISLDWLANIPSQHRAAYTLQTAWTTETGNPQWSNTAGSASPVTVNVPVNTSNARTLWARVVVTNIAVPASVNTGGIPTYSTYTTQPIKLGTYSRP